jgi:RsiW-degrading membrane proteinase PrsW (M82 family)
MNPTDRPYSVADVLFLLFAIVGSGLNFLVAILTAGLAIVSSAGGTEEFGPQWALTFGVFALAGIPAIYYGARKVMGKEDPPRKLPKQLSAFVVIMIPLSIIFGYVGFSRGFFPNVIGPMAHITAATAAAAFAILLVRKYSPALTERRVWGQFSIGLWVVPYLAIVGEFILIIPMIAFFTIGALSSEQGRKLLELLADPSYASNPLITDAASEMLSEAWVLLLVFGFISVLVPILEEGLKTLVIWPLVRRKPTPSEAFIGGVIGGAAYALVEAILLSQQADAWLATMTARAGATLMHAFTTGIACWGLAEGITNKRWGRSILGYLIAIGFHGLWNALAISYALIEGSVAEMDVVPNALVALQFIIPFVIVTLVAIAVFGMARIARKLAITPPGVSSSEA